MPSVYIWGPCMVQFQTGGVDDGIFYMRCGDLFCMGCSEKGSGTNPEDMRGEAQGMRWGRKEPCYLSLLIELSK